jgi:hypothetical protein
MTITLEADTLATSYIFGRHSIRRMEDIIDIIPKNGIFLLKLFSDEKCDELKKIIDETCTVDESKLTENTHVKCFTTSNTEWINTTNDLTRYIKTQIELLSFILSTRYGISNRCVLNPQLRKIYGPTNLHFDGINDSGGTKRNLAFIVALNDDYEGGEIVFPLQDYKVKLKKGQVIVFPPYWTHPHRTQELKNGTFRYTINNWLVEDFL